MTEQKRKKPTVIASLFIEKEGKILIVFDPRFKVWRVPGGRVEYAETLEQTLKREIKEETGVTVKNPKFLGFGQDHQYHFKKHMETSRLILYFHEKVKEDIKIKLDPHEAEDYKWAALDEIKKIKDKEDALGEFFERNPELKL